MIISASRRTDIPAFFPEWFMSRLREGYTLVRNPFNGKESRVDLTPCTTDCIVFWTKNPRPLMKYLDEIDALGYKYYFLFTLNNYPRILEPAVPSFDEITVTFSELAASLGNSRVIWRFDPILLSSVTPEEFITENFGMIARELRAYTKRVIFSFCDFYGKVKKNLRLLEEEKGVICADISDNAPVKMRIASRLAEIARAHDMEISSCAETEDFTSLGIRRGACVDRELIGNILGVSVGAPKDKGQRKECGCAMSRDIGKYATCAHGCVYCYATGNRNEAAHFKPSFPIL